MTVPPNCGTLSTCTLPFVSVRSNSNLRVSVDRETNACLIHTSSKHFGSGVEVGIDVGACNTGTRVGIAEHPVIRQSAIRMVNTVFIGVAPVNGNYITIGHMEF